MARDFRAKQIRTSIVIASGSLTGSNPNLGLVFLSGSKMADFDGTFLTGSGVAAIGPAIPSTPLFDANNQPGFEPGLYLGHNSIGHDVWCLFDGSSNGDTPTNSRRRDGSTVLFMGDVVVSGSLFAERQVIEVDSTVAGNLSAPKDSHLSGGLYSGEQSTGVYALRVNPFDQIRDAIPANTVQVHGSTTFIAAGESRFGHADGYSGDGVTISSAGVVSAKGDIKTDGEIQTAKVAFTDGDDAITIENGGAITLSAGLRNTPAIKVNTSTSSDYNYWVKIAEIIETANSDVESASALFTIRFTNRERSNPRYANITVLLEVSFGNGAGSGYDPVINAEVFDANDSDDENPFDPTTMIELWSKRDSTDPTAGIYLKSPMKSNDIYVSILNGNRDTGDQSDMAWRIVTGQAWMTNAAYTSAKSTFDGGSNQDIFRPRLTEKKYSKVTTSQLTGSAGVAVEMGGQKLTSFYDGASMVISSSANLKLVSNDGAGDVVIDGNFGLSQIAVDQYIRHTGDNNTYFEFPADDQIKLTAGGVEFVHLAEDGTQDKTVINPGGADVDFIVKSGDSNKDFIKLDAENHQLDLGSDASANASMRITDSSITVNPANQATGFQVNDGSGAQLLTVTPATHQVIIAGDSDTDRIFQVKAGATSLLDVTDHKVNGISLGASDIPVKVVGDLLVQGSTTTVDTVNLIVKDPVVLLNRSAGSANAEGGIAIASGSVSGDLVFGRVANDTWGVGSKQTIGGTVTDLSDMTLKNIRAARFECGDPGTYITGDGTDITFSTAGTGDINIPANVGLTFGNDGEKIEGDGTDLRFYGNNLIMSASADVLLPNGIGLAWGPQSEEKIEGVGSNLVFTTRGDINLSPGGSIRVTDDNHIEFGSVDSGEYIRRRTANNSSGLLVKTDATGGALELNNQQGAGPVLIGGNSANLKIIFGSGQDSGIQASHRQWVGASGASKDGDLVAAAQVDLILSASEAVVLNYTGVGGSKLYPKLEFGSKDSTEYIRGDGTDLSFFSGAKLKLSPATSIEIQNDKPLNFDASGNFKIQKGTSSLDITGATINLNATSQVNVPEGVDLVFDAVGSDPDSAVKIKGDSSNNLNLSATSGEVKSDTHFNVAANKNLRFTDNNARVYRSGQNIMFRDAQQTTPVSLTDLNTRTSNTDWVGATGPNRLKSADYSVSIDKQDRYATEIGDDVWFFVDSNDSTSPVARTKAVIGPNSQLVISSSINFIDTNDQASIATITHTEDDLIFNVDSGGGVNEMFRIDSNLGIKLGNGKGLYFNSTTMSLTKATNDFKFSTGNSAATGLMIGDDNDGHDRSIIFGHSTLKTIAGIDDSLDAFIINTDAAFDNTLSNNSLTIDANHNVGIGGDLTLHGGDLTYSNGQNATISIADNAAGDGLDLTITAGGVAAGGGRDNLPGGDLVLSSGASTGTETSVMRFLTAKPGTYGDSATAPEERMRIGQTGEIGIGTTNPEHALHVSSGDANGAEIAVRQFRNSAVDPANFRAQFARGTEGSKAVVQNNDIIGNLAFHGYDGTDFSSVNAEIRCDVDGAVSGDDTPGRLHFRTTAAGANDPTTRMTILSDGKVGIGIDNPSHLLDINGDLRIRGNDIRDNGGNPAITFDGSTNTTINGTLTTKGHTLPHANNTYDLGSTTHRFRNIYTNDLNLCNEGRGNDVDGTSGNWTIQEGEDNLYVINNLTGKKFKMLLQPVGDGE